jgi:hypothetical protein
MPKRSRTGLDERRRAHDGEIRHRRGDTHIGTLRQTYGVTFAKGYRSDTTLGRVLKDKGADTLDQLQKKRWSNIPGSSDRKRSLTLFPIFGRFRTGLS